MGVVEIIGRVIAGLGALLGVLALTLALLVGVDEWYAAYALRHLRRFRRAAVRGRTGDGQVAPLSGTPCAWWRVAVFQWREDSENARWVEVWHRASAETVDVTEGSITRRVAAGLVEHELRTENDVKALVRKGWEDVSGSDRVGLGRLEALGLVPAGHFHDGIVMERFVPVGIPVVAVGRMRRGVLQRSLWGMGVNGVSTLTLEQVRKRAAEQAKETWSMVRGFGLASAVLLALGWGMVGLMEVLSPDK